MIHMKFCSRGQFKKSKVSKGSFNDGNLSRCRMDGGDHKGNIQQLYNYNDRK